MKPPGVLVNGRAGRVARHPEIVTEIRALLPKDRVWVTQTQEEVDGALDALRKADIETLVIVGGDGSASGTLTPLLRCWPQERLPTLLLAAGGTMNTIAKSLGTAQRPDRELATLLDGAPYTISRRPPLRVRVEGEPERYALIFVAGAPLRFLQFYYEHSHQGIVGALHTLLAAVGSIAIDGTLARDLFREIEVEVRIDGLTSSVKRANILSASCVQDVGLGFRPFFTAGQHPDRFHWFGTDLSGLELARRIPRARFDPLGALGDLEHAAARSVELRVRAPLPYSLDADFFTSRTAFRIDAGPTLSLLQRQRHT